MTFDMIEAIASLIRHPLNKWSLCSSQLPPKNITDHLRHKTTVFLSSASLFEKLFFFFFRSICDILSSAIPKKTHSFPEKLYSFIPKKKDPNICWKIKISFSLRSPVWSQLLIGRIKAQPSHMNRFNPLITQVYLHDNKKTETFSIQFSMILLIYYHRR